MCRTNGDKIMKDKLIALFILTLMITLYLTG
jgi:hypothetical protein